MIFYIMVFFFFFLRMRLMFRIYDGWTNAHGWCIADVGVATGGLSSCKIAGVVVGGVMDALIDLVCHYINP